VIRPVESKLGQIPNRGLFAHHRLLGRHGQPLCCSVAGLVVVAVAVVASGFALWLCRSYAFVDGHLRVAVPLFIHKLERRQIMEPDEDEAPAEAQHVQAGLGVLVL